MARKLGIRTIHDLARKLCGLFIAFTPVARPLLPAGKEVYWDALSQACSDFVLNIDPAPLYSDETRSGKE